MLDDGPEMLALQDGTDAQWSANQLDQVSTRKKARKSPGHELQRRKNRGGRPQKRRNIEAIDGGVHDTVDEHEDDAVAGSHDEDDQDCNATDGEEDYAPVDQVVDEDCNATGMEEEEDRGQDSGGEGTDNYVVQSEAEQSQQADGESSAGSKSTNKSSSHAPPSSSSSSTSSTSGSDEDADTTGPPVPEPPEPRQTRPRGPTARPAEPHSFYWRQFWFQWRTTGPTYSWTVCCPYYDRLGQRSRTQGCARTIRLPAGVGAYDPTSLDAIYMLKHWAVATAQDDVDSPSVTNRHP